VEHDGERDEVGLAAQLGVEKIKSSAQGRAPIYFY
jgi:hypothetical protein